MELGAPTYKPSGKLGSGMILMPIVGVASAALLGIVYGYLNVWNPLIYIMVLATFFYGVLLGMATNWAATRAKCRSPLLTVFLGILTGMAGLYFAWGTFSYALLNRVATSGTILPSLLDCLSSPGWLWNFADSLSNIGWFTMPHSSTAVTGAFLWICWGIEAILIVGGAGFIAYSESQKSVFCETCNAWCEEQKDVARAEHSADAAVLSRLKFGELAAMEELAAPKSGATAFFRLDHQICKTCGNMGTYKIVDVQIQTNKDGKIETKEDELTGHVLLTAESVQRLGPLMARGKVAKPAPAAPSAGTTPDAQPPAAGQVPPTLEAK